MGAVGDVYQVVLHGVCLGEPTVNVFWYRLATGEGNSTDSLRLLSAFDANVLLVLCDYLTDETSFIACQVVNWADTSDFALSTNLTNNEGTYTEGEPLQPRYVFSFTFPQIMPGLKAGGKRFSGVSEAEISGGSYVQASGKRPISDLESVLAANISFSTVGANPVIPRRYINGVKVMPNMGAGNPQVWQPTQAIFIGFTDQKTRKIVV